MRQRLFTALGGECEIYAVDATEGELQRGEAWIHEMHDRLTRFSEASELSRFNASAGRRVEVSEELAELLRQSLRAYEISGGLVHVGTLAGLLAAGYTRDFALGSTPTERAPAPPEPLPEVLEVRGRLALLRPGTALDLGGIAKGWLADRLAERMSQNCLVNLCGDLYARGDGDTGEGWPVGFGDKTVLLRDLGAATSGTTKRMWGPGLHHLIDPRTMRPAATDLEEASVIASTATDAEIFAKVALLLGRDGAETWLKDRSLGWSLV